LQWNADRDFGIVGELENGATGHAGGRRVSAAVDTQKRATTCGGVTFAELQCSLRAHRKIKQGDSYPNRDAQFEYLNPKVKRFLAGR
jgi:hypothetical protein